MVFFCYNKRIYSYTNTHVMYLEFLRLRLYPAAVVMTSMVGSLVSPVYAAEKPFVQEFVVTAYYSPLPGQSAYFRGDYEEEIEFNGKGIAGADGTPVYAGMLAGPPTYDFGTVVDLPGLGVGTVHDRGGRIVEWGDDLHRIDIWMGSGEEGLARALAWGARRIKGTVYPVGSQAPGERMDLSIVPVDLSLLASLPKPDTSTMLLAAQSGDKSSGARKLQEILRDQGYFDEEPNGFFGPATQAALKKFQQENAISGDGTAVDTMTVAALLSSEQLTDKNLPALNIGLAEGGNGTDVKQAQKLLRYLGYYRGRTDGEFDHDMRQAVVSFQMDRGVIEHRTDEGAGRIGPVTKAAVLKAWKGKVVAAKAKTLAVKMTVAAKVKDEGIPGKQLSKGSKGKDVKTLQAFLSDRGYLKASDITGTFGPRTEKALIAYQVDRKIIATAKAKGAGVFGPATKTFVHSEALDVAWKSVRADGIKAL